MKRSTLLAALVLAALAGYLYWSSGAKPTGEELSRVFDVDEAAIERIEIRRRGSQPVVIARDGGESFRLVAPLDTPADRAETDLLLQNLESLTYERTVGKASGVNLADFGLAEPAIEVRFRVRGGIERSISFGKDTPTPSNQYARRDEADEILVVRSHRSLNFDKSDWDLRDKSVFDREPGAEPTRIRVERPSGILELERENGVWRSLAPRRVRADGYEVSSFASRLLDAEMRDVVSESGELDESYGLTTTSRSVRVDFEDEASPSLWLFVGAELEGRFYARSSSRKAVFLLGADVVEELDRKAEELWSRKLFDYSSPDVTRFRIGERVVEREPGNGGKWTEAGRELDRSAVEDFLRALGETRAAEILPGRTPAAFDLVLSVWAKTPAVEEQVLLEKESSGLVYAHREGDEVRLRLSESDWARIEDLSSLEGKSEAQDLP